MTWISELSGVSGDGEVVRVALTRNGYEIYEDSEDASTWLVQHPKYNQFASASEVHEDTKSIISQLVQMAELEGIELSASAGSVRRVNPDGTTNKNIFVTIYSCIRLETRVKATIIYNSEISEEERLRRQAGAEEHEAARKRAAAISRVSAAINNPTVIQISKLVRTSDLTMTEAGHIIDIVKDDLNGDLSALTTKAELKRFERSINHPEVMGLAARHAVTNEQPPPRPMTEEAARSYAKRIGREWLNLHANDT